MPSPLVTTIFDEASKSADPSAVIKGFLEGMTRQTRLNTAEDLLDHYVQQRAQQAAWIQLAKDVMHGTGILTSANLSLDESLARLKVKNQALMKLKEDKKQKQQREKENQQNKAAASERVLRQAREDLIARWGTALDGSDGPLFRDLCPPAFGRKWMKNLLTLSKLVNRQDGERLLREAVDNRLGLRKKCHASAERGVTEKDFRRVLLHLKKTCPAPHRDQPALGGNPSQPPVAPTGVTNPSRSATTGQSRTRTESADAEPAARPSKRQRVVIEIDSSDSENEPEAQEDQQTLHMIEDLPAATPAAKSLDVESSSEAAEVERQIKEENVKPRIKAEDVKPGVKEEDISRRLRSRTGSMQRM